MRLETLHLGPISTNCYIVIEGDRGMVVDPGGSIDGILRVLQGVQLERICLTHRHWDHILGVDALVEAFPQACVCIHEVDADAVGDPRANGAANWGFSARASHIHERLVHGDVIELGSLRFRVLHTPGHSAGSCCFYEQEQDLLFAGDTLFAGGSWGRTDLPSGSWRQLEHSMRDVLSQLPDQVAVHPGHGPSSTIGAERRLNPYLRRL
ncbi:MAG: MBL fold metallo-hydrolase [Coriobacteriales bacterium]|nr:MBL fold metallo-hydrolase [Coriobacteriales bacterium]